MEINFLSVMEGLVSNDVHKRNKNLNELNKLIVEILTNQSPNEYKEYFSKIWKSIFYLFWNTDKPINQKLTAEDIAFKFNLFENEKKKEIVLLMNSFLTEFLKKWAKIDFLRLDKYIMLLQTIFKKFFDSCLEENHLDYITQVFEHLGNLYKNESYNFSFMFNCLKCISYLIEEFFERKNLNKNHFEGFVEKLLDIFSKSRDDREIESFKENIMKKLSEKLRDEKNLREILQEKVFDLASSNDDYDEKKRKILFKFFKHLKYINKPEDEVQLDDPLEIDPVDPVNSYILKKSYSNPTSNISKKLKRKIVQAALKNSQRSKKILLKMEKEKLASENSEQITKISLTDTEEINEKVIQKTEINKENKDVVELKKDNLKKKIKPTLIQNETEKQENVLNQNSSKGNEAAEAQIDSKNSKKKTKVVEVAQNNEIQEKVKKESTNKKVKIQETDIKNVHLNGKTEETKSENQLISKKRNNTDSLEKNTKKKAKPVIMKDIQGNKKVSFNLSHNLINNYDLHKPISISNPNNTVSNLAPTKGVLKEQSKKKIKTK